MKYWLILIMSGLLCACGGSNTQTLPTDPDPNITVVPYQNLFVPPPSAEVLHYANGERLERLLKNGARMGVSGSRQFTEDLAVQSSANAVENALSVAQPSLTNFSETNVQVSGVAEADYVKYDGHYLYVHAWPENQMDGDGEHRIRVLQTEPERASAVEVSHIPLPQAGSYEQVELYLQQGAAAEALVVLSSGGVVDFASIDAFPPNDYLATNHSFNVDVYDLGNPAMPTYGWGVEIDGQVHTSRKMGNTLYVVSSYSPHNGVLGRTLLESPDEDTTEAALADISVESLIPTYSINGEEPQMLHDSGACLVGNEQSSNAGYSNLHYVIAIDLTASALADVVCIASPVTGVYSSTDAIYLSASVYDRNWVESFTVLHKLNVGESGVTYSATGAVPGHLGWSSPSFRMDENEGFLRVLSSAQNESGEPDHRLWVLEQHESEQTLEIVAQLPNDGLPAPIGHPGEEVFAVRFFGEQAYIVTFRRTDPLYVLDLSNPLEPIIAGAVELPGFSTYLHPFSEGYMFGFGREADENGREQGLKAALFDVRQLDNPQVVSEIVLGGNASWSDALYDHRAFNFLRTEDGNVRITFPATLASTDNGADPNLEVLTVANDYTRALVLLEIDGLAGESPEMHVHGTVQKPDVDEREWFNYSVFGRGILHGDAIFYVEAPDVWGARWSNLNTISGPH